MTIRTGRPEDLPEIAAIQNASPEAAHWKPDEYLGHDLLVAILDSQVVGFLVTRTVAGEEHEILNLAVHPDFRRRGIGRKLLERLATRVRGAIFLEVRQSNCAARSLYKLLGFQEVGMRIQYYASPPEDSVVMKFHSC